MTKITERGMIFNAEMVRAILDGRKTQTRRPVKPQPELTERSGFSWNGALYGAGSDERETNRNFAHAKCPYGKPGDRIWVRETWARYNIDHDSHDMAYRATTPEDWPEGGRWRPSIHMPRWASRILLEITDVRVERLNSISEEDARAEGIIDGGCLNCGDPEPCGCANPDPDATDAFAYLWQSIYGQENWNANPWVWVIEFKRIEGDTHATD